MKLKIKTKNIFVRVVYSVLAVKKHRKDCLLINTGQNVRLNARLEKGFIDFKNFNRQISVPFKIYADFECLLKSVDCGVNNECFSYTSKFQARP